VNVQNETSAPLISAIVGRCFKSFTLDSMLNYVPEFVVIWIEVMAVQLLQIWRDECRSSHHRLSHVLWMLEHCPAER